ncbi:uncharacterized protein LOC143221875 [Lasioglossum baleicum]|uniref:uncharacterized protein LOC143221875 n=1 Tax=Lasioglossum baleicum TaxID=434251 RepID=UPI003FCDE48D
MCCEKMKFFLLMSISLLIPGAYYLLSKKYSTEPDGDVNDLSEGLTAFSPLSDEIAEHTPTTPSKQKANYKYMELVGRGRSYAVLFDNNLDAYLNKHNLKLRNSVTSTPGASLFTLLFDTTTKGRQWPQIVFVKRLQERDALDMHDNAGNGMTRRDRKKAKALGQLLLNNVPNRNYENIQDDYIEDDDDYTKNGNRQKMNWADFQNEDDY